MVFWLSWAGRWLAYVLLMMLTGGILGCIGFLAIGPLITTDYSLRFLAWRGFYDGAFWFMVWAPGVSFVICVIQARQRSGRTTP